MDSEDFQKDNERINNPPPIQDDIEWHRSWLLIRDLKELTDIVNLASWRRAIHQNSCSAFRDVVLTEVQIL